LEQRYEVFYEFKDGKVIILSCTPTGSDINMFFKLIHTAENEKVPFISTQMTTRKCRMFCRILRKNAGNLQELSSGGVLKAAKEYMKNNPDKTTSNID